MPSICCAPRCFNSTEKGYCLTTFAQDPKLRQQWIDAVGIANWEPSKSARLCEVHFDPSHLYCVGNKKLIKKNIIPSFFCKCEDVRSADIKRKPLTEIQLNCNKPTKSLSHTLLRNNHTYFCQKKGQENKNPKNRQYTNEYKEHNYFSTNQSANTKKRNRKYIHSSNCIINKKPIAINTLREPLLPLEKETSEEENARTFIENTNTENNINKILSAKDLISSEKFKLLEEKLKIAEEENKTLKNQINYLEEKRKESTYIMLLLYNVNVRMYLYKVLNKDQQEAILRGTTRGSEWSNETIKKGLNLHFTCGSHGYKQIIDLIPFPSERTLRKKIEHIKFEPGILVDVFKYLELIVPHIPSRWKICGLVFDEMSIKTQLEFDTSTKMYIGNVTLPKNNNTEKLACKALVFQLFGLGFHWKQYVAYHFTPSYSQNDAIKEIIIDILQKCHHVGLKVLVLVCDMGNRGVLTKIGFKTTKTEMVYTVTHPCNPDDTLQLIPDPVHVFKNLKEMAMENRFIYLPQDIIKLYNLPSNIVDMNHIEWLESYQSKNYKEIKLAPKLNKTSLRPNHFNKMKVANSTNVINHATASTLTFLNEKGDALPEMETTAWFIRLVRKWFDIMTGRNLCHALSFHNLEEYNNAIEHFKLVCHVFKNMKVGCSSWKPTQTHVIIATKSMIQLQDRLLNKEEFTFFFPGRASQDSLENGFSNVRRGCSKPTALEFKSRLRRMCIAGGDQAIPNSSYTYDEIPSLLTVLLTNVNEEEQTTDKHCDFPKLSDCEPLSEDVKQIFYRMCGYIVFKLRVSVKCEECYLKLQENSDYMYTPSSLSAFVTISDYTPGAQIRVSNEVFNILEGAERIIWKSKSKLLRLGKSLNNKLVSYLNTALQHLSLSTCHNIKQKLISRFVSMRLKQLAISLSITNESEKASSVFASKTMGAGALADRFKPKKQKLL